MTDFNVRNCTITVIAGDITEAQADAIVNPANSELIMGGGVAGALRRVGGSEIEKEAIRKAPIPVGESVATTAGNLRAKYVIHAPTMLGPAMRTTTVSCERAAASALNTARKLGLSSVAIPGMGTGVGGVPAEEAAKTMIQVVKQHVSEGTSLEHIFLVSTDRALTNAFRSALRDVLD